jgi:hypothetical protein
MSNVCYYSIKTKTRKGVAPLRIIVMCASHTWIDWTSFWHRVGAARFCTLKCGVSWAQGAASKVWDQSSGCPSVVCCHGGALPMLSSPGKTARRVAGETLAERPFWTFNRETLERRLYFFLTQRAPRPSRSLRTLDRYDAHLSWGRAFALSPNPPPQHAAHAVESTLSSSSHHRTRRTGRSHIGRTHS